MFLWTWTKLYKPYGFRTFHDILSLNFLYLIKSLISYPDIYPTLIVHTMIYDISSYVEMFFRFNISENEVIKSFWIIKLSIIFLAKLQNHHVIIWSIMLKAIFYYFFLLSLHIPKGHKLNHEEQLWWKTKTTK